MKPMRRSTVGLFAVAAFIACSAFSCNVNHQAVVAEHDFKIAVQAAQAIEENEFKAGNVAPDFHHQYQLTILHVAQIGEQVAKDLAAKAPNATILAEVSTIVSSVQSLVADGAVGIKNPTTQNNVNLALNAVIDLLKNFETTLGGKV